MVSLPQIDQELPRISAAPASHSATSFSSRISSQFCNDCVEDLALPGLRTSPKILQEYRERTGQLRMLERLFQEQTVSVPQWRLSVEDEFEPFISDVQYKKSLSLNVFDLPLLQASEIKPPKRSLDWDCLDEKSNKTRCQIVPMKLLSAKDTQQKHQIRKLPSVKPKTAKKFPVADDKQHQVVLISEPAEIMFKDFEIGKFYKKKCTIKNVSTEKCKFTIKPLSWSSPFRVKWDQRSNWLAAGMRLVLTVEFKCASLADQQDKLQIYVQNGEELAISIEAKSPPPLLIDYINTANNIVGKKESHSYINCGNLLVGEENTIILYLKNIGSMGRFCFLKESDWYGLEFEIDSSNSLKVGAFTIEPVYFTVDTGEHIEIQVSCTAPCAGAHCEQVVLLCSNSSVRRMDIVCDGVLYNNDWIQLIGLQKTFDVDIQDDDSADSYIDFGQMNNCMQKYHCFSLYNYGTVHLEYHWEVRPAVLPDKNRKSLHPGGLTITPAQGRLGCQMSEYCYVQCDASNVPPGRYCILMVLFVDELPIKCVPLNLNKKRMPSNLDGSNNLCSIEVQSVEVWMDVVEPVLLLVPYAIDFTDFPLICGSPAVTRDITVYNQSVGDLQLSWVYQELGHGVRLSVDPQQFVVQQFSDRVCQLSLEPLEEGEFSTVIRCVAYDNKIEVELEISGVCCRSEIQSVTSSVDFGVVKRGSCQTAEIVAKNYNSIKNKTWTINDLIFDQFDDGLLDQMNVLGSLSAYEGEFGLGNSEVSVCYTLNTQTDKMWCSVVDWGGRYVPVVGNVQDPDVSLSSCLVTLDIMYAGVRYDFSVTVNNHSHNNTAIFWGNPLGQLGERHVVDIHPRFAVLGPFEKLATQINLTSYAKTDKMWCSVVDWGGRYVPVVGNVQDPDVSLSSCLVTLDIMYAGVRYDFSVTVNNHSHNNTAIFWGNPLGQLGERHVVDIHPRFAVLGPFEKLATQINLTSYAKGLLDSLYVPCFVEGYDQPLVLKIEGSVESMSVRVEWDSDTTGHHCVVWPPKECKEIIKYSHFLHASAYHLSSAAQTTLESEHELQNLLDQHAPTAGDNGQATLHTASTPYLNWPIIGGRYRREPMSEEMERHIRDLFPPEEYGHVDEDGESFNSSHDTLYFNAVPLRTAVTQVVYIKNDSPLCSHFEACVAHNFERPQEPVEMSVLEKMERKLKCVLKEDEWTERASKDRGLTVFVEPACGELLPQDYVVLQITVYANSWGCYNDVLLMQLGDLELLTLNLRVSVHQPPVIAPSFLRFGAMQPSNPPQRRFVNVENRSTVPLYVLWQIFSPSTDFQPFGLMLSDGSPFELKLTQHYGNFSSPFFEISEFYTELAPHSTTKVAVVFNPKKCNIKVSDNILTETHKAVLLGYIYLTDQARSITNSEICVREDGLKLEPLTIDMEAFVELPVLSLLNVYNYHILFKCTANTVMSAEDKVWRKESLITVQNNSYTKIKAKLTTEGYFYVSKINYFCPEPNKRLTTDSINLQPGEKCEVTITCEVTQDTLYDCFDVETTTTLANRTSIESGIVETGVISFKQKELKQDVTLELWLYQPLISISASALDFGLVHIEETKVITITLTAPSGEEHFEALIKGGRQNTAFSVNIKSGILLPKKGLPLDVSFSPKICVSYGDMLVIRSCMSTFFWEIPLTGVGTFNYREHLY